MSIHEQFNSRKSPDEAATESSSDLLNQASPDLRVLPPNALAPLLGKKVLSRNEVPAPKNRLQWLNYLRKSLEALSALSAEEATRALDPFSLPQKSSQVLSGKVELGDSLSSAALEAQGAYLRFLQCFEALAATDDDRDKRLHLAAHFIKESLTFMDDLPCSLKASEAAVTKVCERLAAELHLAQRGPFLDPTSL